MTGRTKREMQIHEQQKAEAHRRGIGDFKAGRDLGMNPYTAPEQEHMAKAWTRAWEAEQKLFGGSRNGRKG